MQQAWNPRFRGIAGVRADGAPPAIVADFQRTFAEFKAANDQRLSELKAGQADVVRSEQVERLNGELDRLQTELQAVMARVTVGGADAGAAADAGASVLFGSERGQQISVEEYRAYKSGFGAYLRRGPAALHQVQAALSVGSDPDGGYSVTPDMSGRIVTRVRETSPMRQVANVVTIGTDAFEGFNDLDEAAAGWVGETQARPETGTPQLGKWSIPVHEIYAMPAATQKLLDDSIFSIETWLADKVADKFSRTENAAFVVGDGALKPRGLFSYTTVVTADATRAWGSFQHINTGVNGGFAAHAAGPPQVAPGDALVDTVFSLKAFYRNNAAWMMPRSTVAIVRKIKDVDGNYVWQPDFTQRQGGTLLGFPIVEAEDVPAASAGGLGMAFGDYREAYTIVDRVGIRVLRDPYTAKGYVRFYTTKRTGGGALNFEAVKFVRFNS
jgi:HK97 family phage major capsid protein